MVDENRLREWVEQKLDEGVDPDRVRQSLEETGHDPSIVDAVQDPFQDGLDTDTGSDVSEADEVEEAGSEDPSGEEGGDLDPEIGASSLEGSDDFETSSDENRDFGSVDADTRGEDGNGSGGFSLPSPSLPSLPLWPAAVIALALVAFAGYSYVPWGSVGPQVPDVDLPSTDAVENLSAPSVSLPGGEDGETGSAVTGDSCPDAGLAVLSARVESGGTVASVEVTRNRAEILLRVYRGGEVVGSTRAEFVGEREVSVPATGDRVTLHFVNCGQYSDSAEL